MPEKLTPNLETGEQGQNITTEAVERAEKNPESFEKKLGSMINRVNIEAQRSETEILAELETANIPAEEKEQIRARLMNAKSRFSNFIRSAALFTGLSIGLSMAGYKATQYEVQQQGSEDKIEYTHEDPETTHTINVLCGVENLDLADKRRLLIENMRRILDDNKLPKYIEIREQYYDNLEELSDDELVSVAKKIKFGESKKLTAVEGSAFIEAYIDPKPSEKDQEYTRELYNAIWKMVQECGNPKVVLTGIPQTGFFISKESCYNPVTNTIYIRTGGTENEYKELISELAHAKQRKDKPLSMVLRGTKDAGITVYTMIKELESYSDAYHDVLYGLEGSVEHEAHRIIEPRLGKQIENETPRKNIVSAERAQKKGDRIKLALSKVQKDLNPFIDEIFADRDKELDVLWQKHLEKTKKMKINTEEYEKELDKYDEERDKIMKKHYDIVDKVRTQLETKWGFKRVGDKFIFADEQEDSST